MDNIDVRNYRKMGAHICTEGGKKGVRFSVWAPNAKNVAVVGDFNNWNGNKDNMNKNHETGIWTLFIEGLKEGNLYKYHIEHKDGKQVLKSDPYGFFHEKRPNTASIVYDLFDYKWDDVGYRRGKRVKKMYEGPVNIYEVHLGSWRRKEDGEFMSYRELAKELIDYVVDMGYTHVEIMPLVEHPYDGSWGYQGVGYFSITSRYGEPKDFMYFIDRCHQAGIGVILDWTPAHFCKDIHGLSKFDGTCLYEYSNPLKAENYQWGTLNFDLGKKEIIEYLISSAIFYMDVFHIDGLRVDAVSSMLYLDFGKKHGEWEANKYGGRENIEAIEFMKKMNEIIYENYPTIFMIAEESTDWPLVSSPVYAGGLGYNYKWNMGWMNDILEYMEKQTIHRKYHHNMITFSIMYTYSENFILPLSHDEVVHGKRSIVNKMPGDYWQKFANLRLLYGYMMAHPGKKLLFMGNEFGQFIEWKYDDELDWFLLDYDMHKDTQLYTKELNHFYKNERALWELDHKAEGFEWIDADNNNQSITIFMRKGAVDDELIIAICNFTPQVYENYKVGVPHLGEYQEVFSSDYKRFGGTDFINSEIIISKEYKWHNQKFVIEVSIPPLGVSYFKLKSIIKTSTDIEGDSREDEKKGKYSNDTCRGTGK